MEEQVNDVNAFLGTQDLYLADYSHRHFHRIFGMGDYPGHDFKKGGRLYSPGRDSYQQAPSEVRATFLFNSEATVEIDIGSSFLTIYRLLSGTDFDVTHDPYDIPGLRRFASKSWTVMTFGHDKHHSRWPADTKRKYQRNFEEGKFGDWGTGSLQKDHPFSETKTLMLKALPELIDWPESTIRWGDLQYVESCAVIEAVHILAMVYGVVALPVHDSIRVPASKQELATQVLSAAFAKHSGVAPVLKAK
jgi:hypothetical protein